MSVGGGAGSVGSVGGVQGRWWSAEPESAERAERQRIMGLGEMLFEQECDDVAVCGLRLLRSDQGVLTM